MKIGSLHLKAFGPFTDRVVEFGGRGKSLVMIYGPNEAGKSAMLRAIEALRFQIDPRSPDNFRHDYTDMCVGGTFLNAEGAEVSVMRLKRLKDPLRVARPTGNGQLQVTDTPASSGLQEQLTGRLSQEEYRRMFGLDHDGLRAGGQRLAHGDVEVGASLFEASLGVRDVAAIAQELDAKARDLFTPGARGSRGRINEGLKRYKELQQKIKSATTRPREWQDRFNASERARDEVQGLEGQQRELNARQNLLATLRAAAPVIRELDESMEAIAELSGVPDLPEDAGQRRTADSASLQAAQDALQAANEAEQAAQTRLTDLQTDPAILQQGASIARLVAKAEEVDTLRRAIVQLETQHDHQFQEVQRLVADIDRQAEVDTILALAPTKARQAEIEQRVLALGSAEQALENHAQAAPADQETSDAPDEEPPTDAAMGQLRRRLAELESERNALARLRALPGEIEEADAALRQLLTDLGLAGEEALVQVRPILDAEIDDAAKAVQENQSGQEALSDRIGQIEPEVRAAKAVRDRMRNDQAVITFDEVLLARQRRDQGWQRVRNTFMASVEDAVDAEATGSAVDETLPEAYESAVREADERADGYARDTQAAAELKAKDEEIARYERDLQTLTSQLTQLQGTGQALSATWGTRLATQGLQVRAPLALREWQGLLKQGRDARLALERLRAEQQQGRQIEAKLAEALRIAIEAIHPGSASADDPLSSLEVAARHLEARIQQQQQAHDANQTRSELLADQAQKRAARQVLLEQSLAAASARLAEVSSELRLPGDASPAAVRARLSEMVRVREEYAAVVDTKAKLEQASTALAQIADDARIVSTALNILFAEGPEHLRPRFDLLDERLACAREVQSEQQAAERDLKKAREAALAQDAAISKHETRLRVLCELAGVAQVDLLPDIEARAGRKRGAIATRERCLQQLQASSDLTLEALREHLAAHDSGQLQALQDKCARELDALTPVMDTARAEAERTRRELEAIDASSEAAEAQDALCQTSAVIERDLRPWIQLRLAHRLLMEAQRRFQERAQGPMLERASGYFRRMTDDAFAGLRSDTLDERQVLVAQRADGDMIGTEAMSEGTLDQLYLALRLAAVSLRRDAGVNLPMVLDDVLMTSSDGRAGCVLQALGEFSRDGQVIVFTHHEHLLEVARRHVPEDLLQVATL